LNKGNNNIDIGKDNRVVNEDNNYDSQSDDNNYDSQTMITGMKLQD